MNYLAHFHLSHCDDGLMIGALLGDVIKGPLKGELPARWEQGIILHRQVDAFTDQHHLVQACCRQFPKPFRRFSGIMLDVAFDHFLNLHWSRFHDQPLSGFTDQVYQLLQQSKLPHSAQTKAQRIVQYDLLNNYQDWDFVLEVLAGIGQRLRYNNPLAGAEQTLNDLYPQIENTFMGFYPQLQHFSNQQIQQA